MPQISRISTGTFPISVLEVVLSGLQGPPRVPLPRTPGKTGRKGDARCWPRRGSPKRPASRIGEVSGGQMQRALLCRAVISDPKLLILDEPANFVDNKFENELYRTLRELNSRMAIVMVSHDIGTITSVGEGDRLREPPRAPPPFERHHRGAAAQLRLPYSARIRTATFPHTVLEHHPGDGCCDHDSVR